MEIWKDIEGYEGKYQVSNLGRVKSLGRFITYKNGQTHFYPERIMKQPVESQGYFFVDLWKDGVGHSFGVHRLVAQAFIPNPDNLPQVNHKDENKQNNLVENLEWCTQKYNLNYGSCQLRKGVSKRKHHEKKSGANYHQDSLYGISC